MSFAELPTRLESQKPDHRRGQRGNNAQPPPLAGEVTAAVSTEDQEKPPTV